MTKILQKYRIVDQAHGTRRPDRAITVHRLKMAFPYLIAFVHLKELNVEWGFALEQRGFFTISPACQEMSSFALIPRFEDDTTANHEQIIKAMLLFQYYVMETNQIDNLAYATASADIKMERILGTARIVYESSAADPDVRWVCFNLMIFRNTNSNWFFSYEKAARIFDETFPHISIKDVFKQSPGRGRTIGPADFQPIDFYDKFEEKLINL